MTDLLDYDTLPPETGSIITPAMKKREDDIVWSIELKGRRIYVYPKNLNCRRANCSETRHAESFEKFGGVTRWVNRN